jgi:hypothetical protein
MTARMMSGIVAMGALLKQPASAMAQGARHWQGRSPENRVHFSGPTR